LSLPPAAFLMLLTACETLLATPILSGATELSEENRDSSNVATLCESTEGFGLEGGWICPMSAVRLSCDLLALYPGRLSLRTGKERCAFGAAARTTEL
jgi:hypothetical protein